MIVDLGAQKTRAFTLSPTFLRPYEDRQPEWGFDGLGYFVYKRTYAREMEDGRTEEWVDTCKRVVEGTFTIQKYHCRGLGLPWNNPKAQGSAQDMFERMWTFKFTPPGRGLWMMGTDHIMERGSACLQNCGFASTENIGHDFSAPFTFLMDMSMLGVGVGGDTRGVGKVKIQAPKTTQEPHVVEDTREGWVELIRVVLESFVGKEHFPQTIDLGKLRKRGMPLKTMGGKSAGPGPLVQLLSDLVALLTPTDCEMSVQHTDIEDPHGPVVRVDWGDLNRFEAYPITSTVIVDIFNFVGKAVVAGGIRRTAEIMFGSPDDKDFLALKQDPVALDDRRWASNNSIFGTVGMDYSEMVEAVSQNGEPGILWLENSRAFGRMGREPDYKDHRVMGTNPCGEQPLESFELCCVSGDMRITTRRGAPRIADVVGQAVEVWNGEGWSMVTPFVAAQDKTLHRVHLSDGSYLDCTDDHRWEVLPPGKRKYRQVETKDLVYGSKAAEFDITLPCAGVEVPFAYEWGFFTGDGYLDNKQVMAVLHGADRKLEGILRGSVYKEQHPEGYTEPFARINFTGFFRESNPTDYMDRARALNDKTLGLPDWAFSMDRESTLRFVSGWIESDGNVCKQTNTDNYRVFGTEQKMRDLQLLLRRVGINHASAYLMAEAGEELVINGRETTRNHDLWVCLIPSFECEEISRYCHLKVARRFGSRYVTNNAHPEGAPIDRARKQKIVDIEVLSGKHTTYCFTEPERHMGVFANVLTYQCLVETFPAHHETFEDYQRTLKMAYMYAKTVTLIPSHDMRTNAVMMRNRRIGCSQSGIVQAMRKLGRREYLRWCDQGYDYIQELDGIYSDWLCIPRSIKTTSVKPSGTVSLLAGATPGIHHAHSEWYLRHVRVANTSPLVQACRDAQYPVNKDPYAPDTAVIGFPVHEKNFDRPKVDVGIWEQFENAAALQRHWADNQVSCTIHFQPHERAEVKRCLEVFETQLKGISLLPLGEDDHGYKFPPYAEITEDEYNRLKAKLLPIDMGQARHEVDEKFCTTDACEMREIRATRTS